MTDLKKIDFPLSRKELRQCDPKFRIESIISDGMWYTITKWKNYAKVSEEELLDWIDEHLKDGSLIQSPESAGSKSYRMPLESIVEWYKDKPIELGEQLLDFIFPPRIWDGMTEVEGFNSAPLREIGIVSFSCSHNTYLKVQKRLAGIAKIREEIPKNYKAYCLSSTFVKEIIQEVFEEEKETSGNIRARSKSMRREMVDLSEEFGREFVLFYEKFGKTLVKGHQETINIYLPDQFDQRSQMIVWVIQALEKFDEKAAVPFSGYFNNVMGRWPYDLPMLHLGPELSSFQRERARAIKRLSGDSSFSESNFTSEEIAKEMGWDLARFSDMESKHRLWMKTKNATALTWDESADEKYAVSSIMGDGATKVEKGGKNVLLANKLSHSIVSAALKTGEYQDALKVIGELDSDNIDFKVLASLGENFVSALGNELKVLGE